jgi:hypothetical protein
MGESEPNDDGAAPEPQLLPGEELDFSGVVRPAVSTVTDTELNEKYVAGEVRIVTEQARYPLNTIVSLLESGDYELNPEFQRRHRWSAEKQSRLMESFVMNVPVPPIFLYEDRYSHYEVMDGLLLRGGWRVSWIANALAMLAKDRSVPAASFPHGP